MKNETLLAAVHAAANEPASATADAPANSQQMESPMAEVKDPAVAPVKITSVADLRSAYPDLCASIDGEARTAGATAERERIIGIEDLGVQGHGDLLANLKKDGKTSPAEAAHAVLKAEQSTRGKAMADIKSVETTTSAVKPAPASAEQPSIEASTPDAWKAEYAKTAELQAEFSTADQYVAFKKAEASGQARRLSTRRAS